MYGVVNSRSFGYSGITPRAFGAGMLDVQAATALEGFSKKYHAEIDRLLSSNALLTDPSDPRVENSFHQTLLRPNQWLKGVDDG